MNVQIVTEESDLAVRFVRLTRMSAGHSGMSQMNVRILMKGFDLAVRFVRLTRMSGGHSGTELNECPNHDERVLSCSPFCPPDWS